MMDPTLKAALGAHQLVLERMLAKLFDTQGLADLKADVLGLEDNLYAAVAKKPDDHVLLQKMLANVEMLFDGAKTVQQRNSGTAQ